MYKRISLYAGIALLLIAAAGLVFWETAGRDKVLMSEIIVAASDIRSGAVIRDGMLLTALMPKELCVDGGFFAGQEEDILGRKVTETIYSNQQISVKDFHVPDDGLAEDESYFVIPFDWIAMRSSALRRGDTVEILSSSSAAISLGVYRVAFVKDAEDREIRDIGPTGEVSREPEARSDRTDSAAVIDHIEIIATEEDYYAVRDAALDTGSPSLVLVQRETAR
jgi:hypothetical protein